MIAILDGIEVILSNPSLREQYGRLFKQIGESSLHSCVVVTSPEELEELQFIEGENCPTRFKPLGGLSFEDAKAILQKNKLEEEEEWLDLIKKYRANPLSLKEVSPVIKDLFDGKASSFLALNTTYVGKKISRSLASVFARLTNIEKEIMQYLSTQSSSIFLSDLLEVFENSYSKTDVIFALRGLYCQDLIETESIQDKVRYQLIPVVKKVVQSEIKKNVPILSDVPIILS